MAIKEVEAIHAHVDEVPVILLAGGRGTRLGAESTPESPKSLVRIGDKPLIDYVLSNLLKSGFNEVHCALGFGARAIEEHIEPWSDHILLRTHHSTGPGYGSAYIAACMVPEIQEKQTRMVIFADVVTEAPLDQLVQTHVNTHADITMPVGPAEYPETDHVVTTRGKSVLSVVRNNAKLLDYTTLRPYFVMERTAFDFNLHEKSDIVNDVLPATLAMGKKVVARQTPELYLDCGTSERLERARDFARNSDWLACLAQVIETIHSQNKDQK